MKVAVVAPVTAGVTAEPDWMVSFVRPRYDSVYPYDRSGRVALERQQIKGVGDRAGSMRL